MAETEAWCPLPTPHANYCLVPMFPFEHGGSSQYSSKVGKRSLYANKFTQLFYLLIQLVRPANYGRGVMKYCTVTGGSKNRNSRNPPKVTKSSVYINLIPSSATKSTYMTRKLSKSNASSHEINSFHEIHAFAWIRWRSFDRG